MPKIEVITNVLDLASFIFATPAFYDAITRGNLNVSYLSVFRVITHVREASRPTRLRYIAGALLFLLAFAVTPAISLQIMRQNDAPMLVLAQQADKVFHNGFSRWFLGSVTWFQSSINLESPFFDAMLIVMGSALLCLVIASAFGTSKEKQEKLNRRFLYVAFVMFLYSRALSIMGALRG